MGCGGIHHVVDVGLSGVCCVCVYSGGTPAQRMERGCPMAHQPVPCQTM